MRAFLIDLGVPADAITDEGKALNTIENIRNVRAIIGNGQGRPGDLGLPHAARPAAGGAGRPRCRRLPDRLPGGAGGPPAVGQLAAVDRRPAAVEHGDARNHRLEPRLPPFEVSTNDRLPPEPPRRARPARRTRAAAAGAAARGRRRSTSSHSTPTGARRPSMAATTRRSPPASTRRAASSSTSGPAAPASTSASCCWPAAST